MLTTERYTLDSPKPTQRMRQRIKSHAIKNQNETYEKKKLAISRVGFAVGCVFFSSSSLCCKLHYNYGNKNQWHEVYAIHIF